MKLTVIVPIYNEARILEAVLRRLLATPVPMEREWILIDDGSRDGSLEIARRLQPELGYRLLEQGQNQGKGAAIIRGIQEASGEVLIIQDADFEYDPRDIPGLVQPILDDEADVVFGSRFKKSAGQVHRTYHYLINRVLTMLSNLLSGLYVSDMETCYKVLRTDLAKAMNLTAKRFGIEVELTAYIAKTSARVHEYPIRYHPRTRLQGKKINWRDGIAALYFLAKFNLFTNPEQAFKDLPKRYSTS